MSASAKVGWSAVVIALVLAACAHSEAGGNQTATGDSAQGGAEKMRPPDAGIAPVGPGNPAKGPERVENRIPGEEILATRPTVPELAPFDAPVPTVKTLSNGLKVYLVERPESTLQAVRLVVKRGASEDPVKLPGIASMAAEMLEAGSAGKSQAQLAAAVDAIGGTLTVGAGQDSTVIAMSALKTQLAPLASLLADVALRPNMAAAEFKKIQAQREAELIAARARPEVAADLAFRAAVYGEHPLARPASGSPESVKAMTLAQVKAFFGTFTPEASALIAVGGAKPDEVVKELERTFGKWKGKSGAAKPAAVPNPPTERPRLVVVDFPEKPQSVLRIGHPAVPRSSPDYLALEVANTILGGSFTSRLNANLREKNGFSYGAGSYFAYGNAPGPFMIATNVKTDVTGPALREALIELQGVVDRPLSQEDLEKGKALLAADLVRDLETSDRATGAMAEIFLYDLPLDEYRTFVPRLKALTVAEVNAAIKRVVHPDALTITIAGDVAKVQPQLKAEASLATLPEPQRRSASGALAK